jgi:hypothetical protein
MNAAASRMVRSVTWLAFAASAAVAQIPCYSSSFGANLGLADETMSAPQALGFSFVYGGVAHTQVLVGDNGYVALGASGTAYWSPTAQRLVSDPFPSIRPLWLDLDPGAAGSGAVWFRAVPAQGGTPAHAIVTWDRVFDYGGTTPHSFQLVVSDGGGVRVHYGDDLAAMAPAQPWLVGASPGNNSALNAVAFSSLPVLTNGVATLHEAGTGPVAFAGDTIDWVADGSGGFVVFDNQSCPKADAYGIGCVARFASCYERFASTAAFDLSSSAFRLMPVGGAYVAFPSASAFVPPSAAATNLALGDDTETTVSLAAPFAYPGGVTSSLNIGSNGLVSVASNSAAFDYSPTATEFLAWPNATWAVWRDFIPNATGNVWFEQGNGVACVTWLGVVGYSGTTAGTTPSTFQLQFELATGNVDFVFLGMDTVSISGWSGGEGWLVGWTPAGNSTDPGSIDLGNVLPAAIVLSPADVLPLVLRASGAPAIGSTITLDTSDAPLTAPFGAVALGFTRFTPGISLAAIGMDGCFAYNDAAVFLSFGLANGAGSLAITIPNRPGVAFEAQSLVWAPGSGLTAADLLSSGGITLTIN